MIQTTFDYREDLLLPTLVRDIEACDTPIRAPNIRDDLAVAVVMEMQQRMRPMHEGPWFHFTQLAECAQLLEKATEPLESSSAPEPRGCLELCHPHPEPARLS